MIYNKKSFKLIAHRGGKGLGLENTQEAFLGAIKEGYDGVECDIQTTKDHVFIVYHDLNLKRLTGFDLFIKDANWSEIKDIQLNKKETDGHVYQGKILLFTDFLKIMKNSGLICLIELKETMTKIEVDEMFKLINQVGLKSEDYIIISNSCSIDLLVYIRKNYQDIKTQFVARTNYQDYLTKCLEAKIDLDLCYKVFEENYEAAYQYYQKFKENNSEINLWVINDLKVLKQFLELGVNYVTTDEITKIMLE